MDLVLIPWIHAYDHAVSGLQMLEGELERLLNRLPVIALSTRRQDLEPQARLGYLNAIRRAVADQIVILQ